MLLGLTEYMSSYSDAPHHQHLPQCLLFPVTPINVTSSVFPCCFLLKKPSWRKLREKKKLAMLRVYDNCHTVHLCSPFLWQSLQSSCSAHHSHGTQCYMNTCMTRHCQSTHHLQMTSHIDGKPTSIHRYLKQNREGQFTANWSCWTLLLRRQ